MNLLANGRDGSDSKSDVLGRVDVFRRGVPLHEVRLLLFEDGDTAMTLLCESSVPIIADRAGFLTHLGQLVRVPGGRHAVSLKWEVVPGDLVEAEGTEPVVRVWDISLSLRCRRAE